MSSMARKEKQDILHETTSGMSGRIQSMLRRYGEEPTKLDLRLNAEHCHARFT
jgi:hypothetical protein